MARWLQTALLEVQRLTKPMPALTVDYTDNDGNHLLSAGDTLSAIDGAFNDLDGDTQIASTYRWLVDGAEVSTGAAYGIAAGDAGKLITMCAVSRTDPAEGAEVAAVGGTADGNGDGQIQVEAADSLVSVAVSGYATGTAPQVDSLLAAIPVCVSDCVTANYQWQIEDAVGSGNFVDTAGAPRATYLPVRGDQKRMIQVVASNAPLTMYRADNGASSCRSRRFYDLLNF